MKKSKVFLLSLGALGMILSLASCDKKCTDDSGKCCEGDEGYPNCPSDDLFIPEGFRGHEHNLRYTETYRALTGYNIGTANYAGIGSNARIDGSDLNHVANFVDGLLTNDEYGRLVKNLATSVVQENSYSKFIFRIKENVPWVNENGIQAYGTDENNVTQQPLVVTAYDFVTTAQYALNSVYGSSYNFLVAMFIEGAAEYAAITAIDSDRNSPKDKEQLAILVDNYMKENFNIVRDQAMVGDRIDYIRDFNNVGIKVGNKEDSEEKDRYRLEITLTQSAPFFPTLLTYAPFMPINRGFIESVGPTNFGIDRDKLLYCGPYYWDKGTSNQIKYTRNELYHGNFIGDDVKLGKATRLKYGPAHIKTVELTIAPQVMSNEYTRLEFEAGRIDGFSVSSKDREGWKTYVTGPNNTGTLEYDPNNKAQYPGPYDGRVNSREYDNIDYTWHMTLNVNRQNGIEVYDEETGAKGQTAAQQGSVFALRAELGGDQGLVNTNRAMKIREVRELFVKSYDFETHNKRFGTETIERTQHQMNTYVPPKFAFDDAGNDYIDSYYREYGKNKFPELPTVEAQTAAAKEKLRPGQYDNVMSSESELADYRANARKAIELYNAANPGEQIQLPIVLEAIAGIGSDTNSKLDEMLLTASINRKMNGLSEDKTNPSYADCDLVYMVNNESINDYDTFSKTVNSGWGHLVTWGWAPDYGDPLSYLGSHQTNGELAFATGTAKPVPGYGLSADGLSLEYTENILGKFDQLVAEGKNIHENFAERYNLFAQAEYELLNNAYTILPLYNNGQGWNASLSKGFGYESPSASYGLSRNRLTGMWILTEPITREIRYKVYDKFLEDQKKVLAETGLYYFYDN